MDHSILLIEDEKLLAELLRKKLEESGCPTMVAYDGKTGLAMAKTHTPDLLLLDMMLPQLNGIEVLEAIRRDEKIADLPVIIISNSGQPVEVERAKELGVRDWFVKTDFDPDEIVKRARQYLAS